jgi:hypothetical protein
VGILLELKGVVDGDKFIHELNDSLESGHP